MLRKARGRCAVTVFAVAAAEHSVGRNSLKHGFDHAAQEKGLKVLGRLSDFFGTALLGACHQAFLALNGQSAVIGM